jgi:hypothetical protein
MDDNSLTCPQNGAVVPPTHHDDSVPRNHALVSPKIATLDNTGDW